MQWLVEGSAEGFLNFFHNKKKDRKVKHGCSWSCFSHFTVWPICLMVIFSIWQPEKTQHASKDVWFYEKCMLHPWIILKTIFMKRLQDSGHSVIQIKADYCRSPYMHHTIVGLYDVAMERSPWLKKCPFYDIFCKLVTPKTSFRSISPLLLLRI